MTNATAAPVLRLTERVSQALELRRAGCTYEEIGQTMSCTRQRAHQLVQKGMDRILELATQTAAQIRALELSRLDGVLFSHWPNRGNWKSAEIILRVCERRARLLGLDAPEKIAETLPNGEPLPPALDLSRLSDDQLKQLEAIYIAGSAPQTQPGAIQ
jgi:Sigma-70, region 4